MSDTAAHDANITFDEFIIQAGKQSAAISSRVSQRACLKYFK